MPALLRDGTRLLLKPPNDIDSGRTIAVPLRRDKMALTAEEYVLQAFHAGGEQLEKTLGSGVRSRRDHTVVPSVRMLATMLQSEGASFSEVIRMATVTSRDFNNDVAAAKRRAANEPVIITDRGRPSYVLLSIREFARLHGQRGNIVDELRMSEDVALDARRVDLELRVPDL